MRHEAATIIRDEHRSLGAVVHAMQFLLREIRDRGHAPDYRLLHAMLYYIREFPERLHHPKEDQHLFAAVKRRTHETDAVIAELEREHAQGESLLNDLTVALSVYEAGVPNGLERFAASVEQFADFYWQHMQKEEDRVLPVAERVLTDEDWRDIHAAFSANRDPNYAADSEEEFRRLFTRIVNLAPAPIGLGAAQG
jgi:hemerythrin-like domain-containing protein